MSYQRVTRSFIFFPRQGKTSFMFMLFQFLLLVGKMKCHTRASAAGAHDGAGHDIDLGLVDVRLLSRKESMSQWMRRMPVT